MGRSSRYADDSWRFNTVKYGSNKLASRKADGAFRLDSVAAVTAGDDASSDESEDDAFTKEARASANSRRRRVGTPEREPTISQPSRPMSASIRLTPKTGGSDRASNRTSDAPPRGDRNSLYANPDERPVDPNNLGVFYSLQHHHLLVPSTAEKACKAVRSTAKVACKAACEAACEAACNTVLDDVLRTGTERSMGSMGSMGKSGARLAGYRKTTWTNKDGRASVRNYGTLADAYGDPDGNYRSSGVSNANYANPSCRH